MSSCGKILLMQFSTGLPLGHVISWATVRPWNQVCQGHTSNPGHSSVHVLSHPSATRHVCVEQRHRYLVFVTFADRGTESLHSRQTWYLHEDRPHQKRSLLQTLLSHRLQVERQANRPLHREQESGCWRRGERLALLRSACRLKSSTSCCSPRACCSSAWTLLRTDVRDSFFEDDSMQAIGKCTLKHAKLCNQKGYGRDLMYVINYSSIQATMHT